MKELSKFAREVWQAPHYRRRPMAALRYAYARWIFRRFRQKSPLKFLQGLGIDVDLALLGFSRWRSQLEHVVSVVRDATDGQGGISFADGMILYGLVRALKPEYVVETGVAAGVSTSFFGAALVENERGRLYSIELPAEEASGGALADGSVYSWHEHGAGWAIPSEIRRSLGDRHQVILQDARAALPELLRELPYLDLFFHDDLHTPDHMYWEYEAVWEKLSSRGLLVSDDVNHGWIKFCSEHKFGHSALHNLDRLCALRRSGSQEIATLEQASLRGALLLRRGREAKS
jgi:ribose 1,5-bisphosphokinase PhnN